MSDQPRTFTELLRRWNTAGELSKGLQRHGCEASETLVRRWWNEEMLPDRAWRAFVALAAEEGHDDITLDLLAEIAETPRQERLDQIATAADIAGPAKAGAAA
jgi:hypothetical protein